jgi:hypothetical protein
VHLLKSAIVACCVLLLTACQALRDEADPGTVSVRGVAPTLEHLNISKDTTAQDAFVNDLIRKAGLDYTPRPGDYSWGFVAEAGIYEIGRQCDQYLDVLFRFNRNQRAIRQGLTATGAATASILGVAGVVAMPIAITAVAFGLAASLYDAGVNSVLFTIEPSALRNVVLKGRQAYIRQLDLSKVNSRPRLLIAMQGYLTQCAPATIEANVNNAASGAGSVVTVRPGEFADGALLGAPGATLIQRPTPPATSTQIPATPPQIATAVVTAPVEITPPLPEPTRPRNARPEEVNVSVAVLQQVQKALGLEGLEADGNFGPNDNSLTRTALREFQLGMIRRGEFQANDLTGLLAGKTLIALLDITPMSTSEFFTPFERGYLGNLKGTKKTVYTKADGILLEALLDDLGVSRDKWKPASPEERMKLLRAQLKVVREQKLSGAPIKGVEKAKQRPDVLDDPLYEATK